MDKETIHITFDNHEVIDCVSIVLVPEKALEEPGYIKTMTAGNDAHSKHEFHAMAQMAYYQYQDEELEVKTSGSALKVSKGAETEIVESGMVIYRDSGGEFHVLIHGTLNTKKMLEATNRYCTRWVRLDI